MIMRPTSELKCNPITVESQLVPCLCILRPDFYISIILLGLFLKRAIRRLYGNFLREALSSLKSRKLDREFLNFIVVAITPAGCERA